MNSKSAIILAAVLLSGEVTVCSAQSSRQSSGKDPAALLESGREAFMHYDFETASKYYSDYAARMKRQRKEVSTEYKLLENQLNMAQRQLERVQKITVIDSLAVPAADFFKNVRVPASAGYLLPAAEIPFPEGREQATMAFTPESQSLMLWAQPDSLGQFRIVESQRLTDGKYSEPVMADEILNGGGDVDFPVLNADGFTLYFSGDGEGSMGGYDIFETVRDVDSGSYLAPSNVGMPFNSPYDDFLLVKDEENGVGWWATDRNQLGDKITLYVYILPEVRENIDPEVEDAVARARVEDYRSTWDAEKDYEALAEEVRRIVPGERPKGDEFVLEMPGGKVYTRYDQIADTRLRQAVKTYEKALADFEARSASLGEMRRNYAATRDKCLARRIEAEERYMESAREELKKLRNTVYSVK